VIVRTATDGKSPLFSDPHKKALLHKAGVPVAAGLLYPLFGILFSRMMAAAAIALSSVSVVANALRLNREALWCCSARMKGGFPTALPVTCQPANAPFETRGRT
jgi:hypothetical protein